jgi:hypothetical protein
VLGPAFTPDVRGAWATLYSTVAGILEVAADNVGERGVKPISLMAV